MQKSFAILLLIFVTQISYAEEGWSSQWQERLNSLWQQTKEKTSSMTESLKEKMSLKEPVTIGVAYGTEKKAWLKWAVDEFAKTEAGKNITIDLIPMGSVEGAETLLKQDETAKKIHVWSPASSVVENLLVEQWEGENPILSDAMLALTPMVVVMWADRYDAFMAHYTQMDFKTLAQALAEPTGWAAIAEKPQWGVFTFGHTKPTHSNSGLLTLVLMAYDYADLFRNVQSKHIMDEGFINWLKEAEANMSTDETSTGTLMKTLVQRGPSALQGIVVYENLALTNLEKAEKRWGVELKIVYPKRSVWNDNPYYILNVPWSSPEQRMAARAFQQFLLSSVAQKKARDEFLFRPASVDLPILDEDSAFNALQSVIQIDVPTIQKPNAEVLTQLIQLWERNQ